MICPMCDMEVNALKSNSHIIPKWMANHVKGSSGRKLIIDLGQQKEEVVQDLTKGDIVCECCEHEFEKDDNYMARIVLPKNSSTAERQKISVKPCGEHELWSGVDFKLFQRFVLGVILRMEFYKQKYERSSLGINKHYREKMKDLYRKNSEDSTIVIAVSRLADEIATYPIQNRIDGHVCYQFQGLILEYFAFCSKHIQTNDFFLCRLKSDGSLPIFKEDLSGKRRRDLIRKIKQVSANTSSETKERNRQKL